MTFEDAVRLLMPAGERGDDVHEVILECQREGLIRIKNDGSLVLTEEGRRAVNDGPEDQNEEAV